MEITLEKIEMVKDRTGVSYKEAKEALEKAEGSVVDAIIDIEENIDTGRMRGGQGASIADKLKELIRKGNVSKILIKKDGEVIVNAPVNAGIIGMVIAPVGCIVATAAAFGFKCSIEIVKHDGTIMDVSDAAKEKIDLVKEKGSVAAEAAKEKAADVYGVAKEKASDVYSTAKEKASDVYDNAKEKASDVYDNAKEKAADAFNTAKEKAADAYSNAKEKMEEKKEAGETDIDFSGCFGEDEEIGDTI